MALPNLTTSQRPIRLLEDVKEHALRWVQTQAATTHRTPTDAPFRRLIDFWFASIAWAVSHHLVPVEQVKGKPFVSIGPTPQDVRLQSWKLDLLVLLALREYGHDDPRSQDPAEILSLANRYAETGAEPLLAELDSARTFAVPRLYRVIDLFADAYKDAVVGKIAAY